MGCTTSKGQKNDAAGFDSLRNAVPEQVAKGEKMTPMVALINEKWDLVDKDNSNSLDLDELKSLCRHLNIAIPASELRRRFAAFDKNRDGSLDREEFLKFFHSVQAYPIDEISALFSKYSTDPLKRTIGPDGLRNFLMDFQKEPDDSFSSREACSRLVARIHRVAIAGVDGPTGKSDAIQDAEPTAGGGGSSDQRKSLAAAAVSSALKLDDFVHFLIDKSFNSIIDPRLKRTYQDMSQPLSHYFISSTHNSYLMGNQLASKSSVDALARALSLGARVVELDCYDGPDGPKVTHGGTLTSWLAFEEAIKAINEYAFRRNNLRPSDFPVIITIENHCSHAGQRQQAEILERVLGDRLFIPGPEEPGKLFKSPQELRGKILLRDKPGGSAHQGSTPAETAEAAAAIAAAPEGKAKKPPKVRLCPEYLRLVYIRNVHFGGVHTTHSLAHATSSSLSELKFAKLCKSQIVELLQFTEVHLARVYPKGTRILSGNYDPQMAWNAGVQLAALNYQLPHASVWKNQGKFADNGGAGYVLKPRRMLRHTHPDAPAFNPDAPGPVIKRLHVQVVSAHYLPKPKQAEKGEVIDPFVVVGISGVPADTVTHKTKTIQDNGFNPRWVETPGEGKFTFDLRAPEVAMLSFVVWDQDVGENDIIGQVFLPLHLVRHGYRSVAIYDEYCQPIPHAFLFVKITMEKL